MIINLNSFSSDRLKPRLVKATRDYIIARIGSRAVALPQKFFVARTSAPDVLTSPEWPAGEQSIIQQQGHHHVTYQLMFKHL